MSGLLKYIIVLVVALSFAAGSPVFSTTQSDVSDSASQHDLTIYVMPTMYPLNWSSPSDLYHSMYDCYKSTMFLSHNYLLGHVVVRLKSTLLKEPYYVAMTASNKQEKLDLLFRQKIGMGIMGATMEGRIESSAEIQENISIYKERKKLGFINYQINQKAVQRILTFIENYSAKNKNGKAPCQFYGGAFWPSYEQEGSGCSAFGFVLLQTIGLLHTTPLDWIQTAKIPMDLIGGEYNHNKKVSFRKILKTKSWYEGDGELNKDYINYFVYEPSLIFEWIQKPDLHPGAGFRTVNEDGVPGLNFDGRDIVIDAQQPMFQKRLISNVFLDKYRQKNVEVKD